MSGMTDHIGRLVDVVYSAGMDEESEELKEIFDSLTSEIRRLREENERLERNLNIARTQRNNIEKENGRLQKELKGIGVEQYYTLQAENRELRKEVRRLEKERHVIDELAQKKILQLLDQNAELSEVLRKLSPNVVYQALRHYDKQSLYKESEFMDLYAARDTQPEIIEVLRKYELEGESDDK